MWEIIERTGEYILWQGRDAEGRRIYAATAEHREPVSGLYSKAEAIKRFMEDKAIADD